MNARPAFAIYGHPKGDNGEDAIEYTVGRPYYRLVDGAWKPVGTVTQILVTDDLPGLHCNMLRASVYDGETLIFEAPLHSLEGVAYPAPSKAGG